MEIEPQERVSSPAEILGGLALVWIIGTLLTVLTAALTISGKLWDMGIPKWLIFLSVLVGVWQWLWVLPTMKVARRQHRLGFYNGLLWGGILFSVVNIIGWVAVFVLFRHASLQ